MGTNFEIFRYKLAENIDSRLKKTLETSKEIITKINDKNRSSENVTNPVSIRVNDDIISFGSKVPFQIFI